MTDEALRWFLAALNLLVAMVGISGNVFVLYASRFHGALKIDKISVIFLESLAVSDVIMSLCMYLTEAVQLMADRLAFGTELCYVVRIAIVSATYNETLVIAVLSVYRMWMLKKPPGARNLNLPYVYLLAGILQVLGAGVHVMEIVLTDYKYNASASNNSCVSEVFALDRDDYKQDYEIFQYLVTGIFVLVPLLVTITSTARIFKVFLGYDNKTGRKHERAYRVIKLLLFVCVTFVLSYITIIIQTLITLVEKGSSPQWLKLSINYFLAINVISNPFIYVVISPYFRAYLKTWFVRVRRTVRRRRPSVSCSSGPPENSRGHSTVGKSEDIVTHNKSEDIVTNNKSSC